MSEGRVAEVQIQWVATCAWQPAFEEFLRFQHFSPVGVYGYIGPYRAQSKRNIAPGPANTCQEKRACTGAAAQLEAIEECGELVKDLCNDFGWDGENWIDN
jgi:hypothetical protein